MDTNIWGETVLDSKDYYDKSSVLSRVALRGNVVEKDRAETATETKNVFYTQEGEFLGYDDTDSGKVYISTRENYEYSLNNTQDTEDEDRKPDYEGLRKNSTDLRIKHTDFINKCSAVYGESSIGYGIFIEEELYAIASVHIRNSIAYGVNSKSAVKFKTTSLLKRNNNNGMKTAIAAFINALQNGIDYSNGANQWDGAEQAMIPETDLEKPSNGKFMYKVNVMGWDIKDEHYTSWKTAIENKFGSGKFTAPQKQEALFNYAKMTNKGKIRLFSKAQFALTMFWKEK